jgi:hypothetical protein
MIKIGITIHSKKLQPAIPDIPTGLTLTLISGGVKIDWTDNSGGTAQTEIWVQNNGGVSALLYTINAGIITKNDTAVTPVDLRYYKIRSKKGTNYSAFTLEVSIAMLGANIISNGTFTDATGWDISAGGWTISGGKANFDASGTLPMGIVAVVTTLKTYHVKYNISNCTSNGNLAITNQVGTTVFDIPHAGFDSIANGDYDYTITCKANSTSILIYGNAGGVSYSLDNLSIKEVL